VYEDEFPPTRLLIAFLQVSPCCLDLFIR